MPVVKTVGQLSTSDLGKTVRIFYGSTVITGPLYRLSSGMDLIEERRLGSEKPALVPGGRTVDLTVGVWSASGVWSETDVEVDAGMPSD